MLKRLVALLACCLFSSVFADSVAGFWQTVDDSTGKPSSVIAVYSYEGAYYGRILGSFDAQGEIDDSIYHPEGRASGIEGNPYYAGLDILWDMEPSKSGRYKGCIIDPKAGKTYKAELWRDGDNLILRGKVFIFGKNITWPPFPESGFNKRFKKPDISTFVPAKPITK